MKRCIILTGIKHAGKTSAARALALHVNAPFFDIDELIEKSVKMSCRELYTAHGQAAFQKEEFKACRLFCAVVKKYGTTGTESTASAKYTDDAETTDSKESTNGFDTQSVHQNGSAKTGCSLLYLAVNGTLAGIIAIEDPVRTEAKQVIQTLYNAGIQNIIMLTGDGEKTAKTIAEKLGIRTYRAQVLPDEKSQFIEKLKNQGHRVVMIGDGINDSPALSAADVGIAMGQAASIASETADILLPDNGLRALVNLHYIGSRLIERIKINNALIVGINSALIAAELSSAVSASSAALLHNGSTLAIGMEAMRSFGKN